MDIKQLKYFLAIAEEKSITGAAKRLNMAQPPLSQQLKLLENELGVKLVERTHQGVRLTDEGHLLNNRSEQILALIQTTATEIKELHEGYAGILSIGAVASSGVTLLPNRIHKFHKKYPNISFQLWEGDTFRILELLNNGIIEIGIVRSIFDTELYQAIKLPDEPMIAAMNNASNCTTEFIHLDELKDIPLLLHRNNSTMIVESCRQAGFDPQILCKGDDVRSLLVLADAGIGLAIVPKSAIGLVPSCHLSYREIIDTPLKIEKSVIWIKNRYLSATARNFLEMIPDD